MNFFLHINRKFILILSMFIIICFLILIFTKQLSINKIRLQNTISYLSNVDISEPKFTINNESKKIHVTAKEGNFLEENKILLRKNVRFKSNEFSIETEKVIFDRNKQTANSKNKSTFKSKNTSIFSEGFNIYDNGDKIIFYGNSTIILK